MRPFSSQVCPSEVGIYRQYLAGKADMESEVANDATAIQADMAVQAGLQPGLR